jgi:hypothetical protein
MVVRNIASTFVFPAFIFLVIYKLASYKTMTAEFELVEEGLRYLKGHINILVPFENISKTMRESSREAEYIFKDDNLLEKAGGSLSLNYREDYLMPILIKKNSKSRKFIKELESKIIKSSNDNIVMDKVNTKKRIFLFLIPFLVLAVGILTKRPDTLVALILMPYYIKLLKESRNISLFKDRIRVKPIFGETFNIDLKDIERVEEGQESNKLRLYIYVDYKVVKILDRILESYPVGRRSSRSMNSVRFTFTNYFYVKFDNEEELSNFKRRIEAYMLSEKMY